MCTYCTSASAFWSAVHSSGCKWDGITGTRPSENMFRENATWICLFISLCLSSKVEKKCLQNSQPPPPRPVESAAESKLSPTTWINSSVQCLRLSRFLYLSNQESGQECELCKVITTSKKLYNKFLKFIEILTFKTAPILKLLWVLKMLMYCALRLPKSFKKHTWLFLS